MNWQRRHGMAAQTRSPSSVWQRTGEDDDQWMPAWVWTAMGLAVGALIIVFLPELRA